MTTNGSRAPDDSREAALRELRGRAEEIREAVRLRVLRRENLLQATLVADETPEDVAQAVFLKLWAVAREGDAGAIRDVMGYAKTIADNHVASLARRPGTKRIELADPERIANLAARLAPLEDPAEEVEQRLSAAQVASIVDRLSHKQRLLVKMHIDLGMNVPQMAKVVGESPKACEKQLERAKRRIREELAVISDLDAADRRRLSRVMAVKRWGTPGLVDALRRDIAGDMRLASLWRQSNGALHDVAGAVAVDESLDQLDAGPRLTDRAIGVIDRGREVVLGVLSRGGPEHEAAAGGLATGGAGVATKAIVAACIGGGAAGVGGACVATGVVDLAGDGKAVAERPVEEPTTTEPSATSTTPDADAPFSDEQLQVTTTVEKPVEQVNKELYGGGSTGPGSSTGSRDFAAPVGSSSGRGGGGGGGSGSRENFGP